MKKIILSLFLSIVVLVQPAFAANSATLQDTIYMWDSHLGNKWPVYVYRVVIDTGSSDLTIRAANATSHIAVVGVHGLPSAASDFIIKSGSTQLVKYQFAANQSVDYRIGRPLWITAINEALVFNVSTTHNDYLFYVIEFGQNETPPYFD